MSQVEQNNGLMSDPPIFAPTDAFSGEESLSAKMYNVTDFHVSLFLPSQFFDSPLLLFAPGCSFCCDAFDGFFDLITSPHHRYISANRPSCEMAGSLDLTGSDLSDLFDRYPDIKFDPA